MADFTENFKDAPNGNVRQFGMLASTLGLGKKRNTGPKSISAKDQSALMAQQHAHNMELESHKGNIQERANTMGSVVGHVLGQNAASNEHKRSMQASRLSHKQSLEKSNQEHMQNTDTLINNQTHERSMAQMHHENTMGAIQSLADRKNVQGVKFPNGGSVQFRDIQASE